MANLKYEHSVLRHLGLPTKLLDYIRAGKLHAKIGEAYALIHKINAKYAEVLRDHPELTARAPWAAAYREFVEAGSPEPPWYEALLVLEQKSPYNKLKNLHQWPYYQPNEERRHQHKLTVRRHRARIAAEALESSKEP